MILKGEIGVLDIEILSRNNVSSSDFWEANWLRSLVKGDFPGFRFNFKINLRAEDFLNCLNELHELLSNKKETAQFLTLEEGLSIYFIRDSSTGGIMIKGKAVAVDLTGCSLDFNFKTDNPGIEKFAMEIAVLLKSFPVVGNP